MGNEMGNQNVTGHQVIEEDDAEAVKAATGSAADIVIPNNSKTNLESTGSDSIHRECGKEFESEYFSSENSDYRKHPSEPNISSEFEELQEEQIGPDNTDQIVADEKPINRLTPAEREKKEKNSTPDALPKLEQTVKISEADINCEDRNLPRDEVSHEDITKNSLNNESTKEHTTQDENSINADTGKANEKIATNYDEILENAEKWTDGNNLTDERSQMTISELAKGNQEMGAIDFSKELAVQYSFMQLQQEYIVPIESVNIYLDPIDLESGNSLDPPKLDDRDVSRTTPIGAWNEEELEGGNINELGDNSFHNQEESSDLSKQEQETIKCQNDLSYQEAAQASKTQSIEFIYENHEDHHLILTLGTSLAQEMMITDSTSVIAIIDNEFADNKYGNGREQETHDNGQDLEFGEDISLEISHSLFDDVPKSSKDSVIMSNEDSDDRVNLQENDDGRKFDARNNTLDKLINDRIKEVRDESISEDEDTYEIDLSGGSFQPSHISESTHLSLNILQLDHVSEVRFPELQQKLNADDFEMVHELDLRSSVDLSPNMTDETCFCTSDSEEFKINRDGMNSSVSKIISHERMLENECTELSPNSATESGSTSYSSEHDSVGNFTARQICQEPIFQQNKEEVEDYSSRILTAGTVNSALLCQQENGEETTSLPLVDVECFVQSSVNKSAESSSNNIALASGGIGEHETRPPSNTESPKTDSFSSATSVLESELHVNVEFQSTTEKDDKEMPLHQQQEDDRRQVFLESNNSGKDSKPSFSVMNQEVHFTESWKQNQGVALTNSANSLRAPSVKKEIAQPHRERGKHTAKSFFSSCMCCTTTAIS